MALPAEHIRYSFADQLKWDGNEAFELIGGDAVMMSPPARIHQKISMELSRQLSNFLEGKPCEVYAAPFAVRLFQKEGDRPEDVDTVVEPDLSVVCDPDKLDSQGCKGAPDLVIEILSPSTHRHDRIVKLGLYQRAGVREYWIVSPAEKTVLVFLLDGKLLIPHELYNQKDIAKVNILEGCFIELQKVFPED